MSSRVWCDRTPFNVEQSPSEVEQLVEDTSRRYKFVWLDRDGTKEQIALAIDKISCIEKL